MRTVRALRLAAAIAALVAPPLARAQDVATFYQSHQIRVISGSAVGESTTSYERVLARFMPKYIPGHPTMVVENMLGAGGVTAANMVANTAPRDGTVIGDVHGFVPLMPLFGMEGPRFDANKLYYLGAMYRLTGLCIGMKRDGVTTFEDMRTREVVVGTSGPTTEIITFYNTLKSMLGAKLKIIHGYASSAAINLAMEHGELQARCGISWTSMKASKPEWARGETVNILLQLRLEKDPALPDVPVLGDFVSDPKDRAALAVLLGSPELGFPLFLAPDAPAERARALRDAFAQTMKDPEFQAEVERQGLYLSPRDGESIQTTIAKLYQTSPDILARVRDLATTGAGR